MVIKGQALVCAGRRRDGAPCRAVATIGAYCLGHAPELEAKRQEARRQGGLNKARAVRLGKMVPRRLMPIYDVLEEALGQVHKGDLTPQQATAMAALAGAMVKVLTSGELEQRVRQLEERGHSGNNGGSGW